MKLSELGSHSLDCPQKPTGDLDAKVSMKDLTVLCIARITAIDLILYLQVSTPFTVTKYWINFHSKSILCL